MIIKRVIIFLSITFLFASSTRAEPEWKLKEIERKARVRDIVDKLAKGSVEVRPVLYTELRDKFVRKRDIPWLAEEIGKITTSETQVLLQELIKFINGHWRLAEGGWTDDHLTCAKAYDKKFEDLGYFGSIHNLSGYPYDASTNRLIIGLSILDSSPPKEESNLENMIDSDEGHRIAAAIELIQILEPQVISISQENWESVDSLSILNNLEEITIGPTSVRDLKSLKELTKLRSLSLMTSGSKDLSILKELSQLQRLNIRYIDTNDLKPLQALSELKQLSIENMPVVDLSPLSIMTQLSELNLWDVPVNDLTHLAELKKLKELSLKNTKVTDLKILKDFPNLERIYLDDAEGVDLTPLAGSTKVVLPIKQKRLPQW